jgi:hypothetical protein
MCRGFFFFVLLVLLLPDVLPAQDTEETWYLISEQELQSIEQYKETSEAEKQTWLLQVQNLRTKAENSEARSVKLEAESENLNRQLSTAREAQRKSEQLYEQSENEKLTLLSSKNGEIAGLKEKLAAEKIQAEKYKGLSLEYLIIIMAMALVIIGYFVIRLLRLFRIIPV